METIFRTHGLPESVHSDNAPPPFAPEQFERFLEYLEIHHKKGVAYWPQRNGELERCDETLLKLVRIARLEGRYRRKAVPDFLFQYRDTPHTITGMSPAELLMGRRLRDKLPKVEFSGEQVTEGYWQQKEYDMHTEQEELNRVTELNRMTLDRQKKYCGNRQQTDSKLSPNYEPDPCVVAHKHGNAVVLQDAEGNCKMSNIAHMKKFVEPATIEIEASRDQNSLSFQSKQ